MSDTQSGSNPLSPDRMSADERLAEVAEILAAGLMRLLPQQSTHLSADGGDSSLDILALKSGRGRKRRNRFGGC
jgi:hypothetical protein